MSETEQIEQQEKQTVQGAKGAGGSSAQTEGQSVPSNTYSNDSTAAKLDANADVNAAAKPDANSAAKPASNLTANGHELPNNWFMRIALIWSGYAFSAFMGSAASYAGIWFVTESTGSPLALAFLYVLAFLPMGLLSPFGGVLADKHNRKKIIILCDSIMCVSALLLAATAIITGPSFLEVALFCASYGFVQAFRAPAFYATMPLLVPERHLVRINSLDTLLGSISMIAAPALGILLYTSFGLQACFVISGIGTLAAVLTMFLAQLPHIEAAEQQVSPWQSVKEGVLALSKARGLLILTIGVSLGMMAYGPIDSLLPLMVSSHFGGDGFAASFLAAVMGFGLLVGTVVLMTVNPSRRLQYIIIVSSVIVGVGAFIGGCVPEDGYIPFVVCIGVLAIACAWFNAPLMTLLQKGIEESKLGRVMGLMNALTGLAIPVGTAVGGVIAELIGTPLFFSIDGIFILLIGVALLASKSVRALS